MIPTASELAEKVSRFTNDKIMEQLNDFISRGLIEVKLGPPIMTLDNASGPNIIKYQQSIILGLKDKEYIQKLEAENKKYKEILSSIKGLI